MITNNIITHNKTYVIRQLTVVDVSDQIVISVVHFLSYQLTQSNESDPDLCGHFNFSNLVISFGNTLTILTISNL